METQQESSSRSQSQSCGREKKGQSQADATGELHKCTPLSNLKKEQLQKKSVKPPAHSYSNYKQVKPRFSTTSRAITSIKKVSKILQGFEKQSQFFEKNSKFFKM